MAMRIRYAAGSSGLSLGYSIERMADGLYYDFAAAVFSAAPGQQIATLPEDMAPGFAGRHKATLTDTPIAIFPDGDYCITVHHQAEDKLVQAELGSTMRDGDDATFLLPAMPWSVSFPGPLSIAGGPIAKPQAQGVS